MSFQQTRKEYEMRRILVAMALMMTGLASAAHADLIVVNGRYIVEKDSVRAYFYRQRGQEFQTVFDVRWSDWSTQYRCRNTYDQTLVLAASLNLVSEIKQSDVIDFGEFLTGQGFRDCEKF